MKLCSTRLCAVIALCAGLGTACESAEKKPAASVQSPAVPMMPASAIPMSLSANYGFMSLQFKLGDITAFASNYADTASLTAPGLGTVRGREIIAAKFAGQGVQRGVSEFRRVSSGFRMVGRDVIDSGTYQLVTIRPADAVSLGATGRYWTRWHFANNAEWIIGTDSLVADSIRSADRASR